MRFLTPFLSAVILGTSLDASEEITFRSQANQDEFVYTMLYKLVGKQDVGYYLEIGAGEPIYINNTYVLEKECGWQGLSIDISDSFISGWAAERKNPLISEDAIRMDYCSILEGFPQVIDYLSLDVDGYYDTVLRRVLLSNRIFKIITIEHDAYRYGDLYRAVEREILTEQGYHLLCADVSYNGCAFEDWWIHADFFSPLFLQQLASLNLQGKDCMEVVRNVKTLTSLSNY